MYIPKHFAEHDVYKLHEAIERYSFATLVSQIDGELEASHLPLLLDRSSGAHGTLLGHMARANLQWRRAAGQQVLVIFSGPHAYISPQWYQATEVVPTWNYVAVHAYGHLELIDDDAAAKSLLDRMVALFESGQPRPWEMNGPAEFVERLLRQIVAFRIPIERLEGKWKLSQNRPSEQRQRVIDVLSQQPDDHSKAIANLMRGNA
jgi:transcriptional regulator